MRKTFCIGDIHGCLAKLRDVLTQCESDAAGGPATYVFVGDYLDRGPDSRGVIDTLMALEARKDCETVCLKGNHEVLALMTLDDPSNLELWLTNGGGATLRSFGVDDVRDLPPAYIAWLRKLRTYYDDGLRFFVHAGINPAKPVADQTDRDMIWIREPFLSATGDYGRIVVHGHTPTKTGLPEILPNRVDVDTGAVYGGPLTAAIFTDEQAAPLGYLQSAPGRV